MILKLRIQIKNKNLQIHVIIKKQKQTIKPKFIRPNKLIKPELGSILCKNLRHLDFINKLELIYGDEQLKTLTHLEDLMDIKRQAQIDTLQLFNNKVA